MYLRAESHNKVATIIFYFARAVSHATVERDRRYNPNTVAGKPTTPEAGTQKVGGKIRISGRLRTLYSQSDFRGKNCLFGLLFLKHNLHLILPMMSQKKSELC